jgi:Xaa-Pro aminopeptidase
MVRGFPPEEFEARWERLRSAMTQARLDAVLVSTEANFQYICGFSSQTWVSPTRPRYLILPRNSDPIAIVPTSNAQGIFATTPVRATGTMPLGGPTNAVFPKPFDATAASEFRPGAVEVEHINLASEKREVRPETLREVNATTVAARLVLVREGHRRVVGNGRTVDCSRRLAEVVFAVHLQRQAVP